MDDLVAAFMPKFVASARKRLARSLELASQGKPDAQAVARELHAIAGEAGLLGIQNIVALARAGEDHAKRMRTAGSDADAAALIANLHELQSAIELVHTQKGPHE